MVTDSIFLVVLFLLSLLAGNKILYFISHQKLDVFASIALSLPLGLGIFGSITGICGTLGSFELGLLLSAILGMGLSVCNLFENRNHLFSSISISNGNITFSKLVFIALVLSVWVGIHGPVIDGDALCYHLEVAKRMAFPGGLVFDPDLHETAYPLVVESLQSVAMYFSTPVATRSISFLFGLSLAASTVILARCFVSQKNSVWAGSLILSLPIINCGMISPLNDVPLAALCAASLAAFYFHEENVSFQKRVIISAIYCGFACGVKFPGIVWTVVLSMVIFCHLVNMASIKLIGFKNSIKIIGLFGAVVLIAGGYWYMRAAVITGNPVHPYFRQTFDGNGLDEVLAEDQKSIVGHVINIMTAPVVMSLAPVKFDSFSQQTGPVILAILPLGMLLKMQRKWFVYILIAWFEMVLCLSQRQSPRFFLASFAPLCAASIAVVFKVMSLMFSEKIDWKKFIFIDLAIVLILITLSFNLARVKTSGMILVGLENQEEWLASHEPTAKLRNWVDLHLPADAKIIGQDHRGFYWPRLYTMEKAHRRRLGIEVSQINSEAMIQHFNHSGFTHLVMAEPVPLNAVEFDNSLSIILEYWLKQNQPMIDVTLSENDGYQRRYRIYDIRSRFNNQNVYPVDDAIQRAGVMKFNNNTNNHK